MGISIPSSRTKEWERLRGRRVNTRETDFSADIVILSNLFRTDTINCATFVSKTKKIIWEYTGLFDPMDEPYI